MTYFILDAAGEPVEATREEWVRWFGVSFDARVIDRTEVGDGTEVSTVFLTIDRQRLPGQPPLLFETMIFDGQWDSYSYLWRWSTRAEAVAGHARIVAALRDGRSLDAEGGTQ